MYELEYCPFCGGIAQILHGGLLCMASVECTKCGATVKAIDDKDPIGIAVKKWNTRASNKKEA